MDYMTYDEMLAVVENSGGQDNPIYKELKDWTAEEIQDYENSCSWCCYSSVDVVRDGFIMRCHKSLSSVYEVFYGDDGRVIRTELDPKKVYVEWYHPIEYKAGQGELKPDWTEEEVAALTEPPDKPNLSISDVQDIEGWDLMVEWEWECGHRSWQRYETRREMIKALEECHAEWAHYHKVLAAYNARMAVTKEIVTH